MQSVVGTFEGRRSELVVNAQLRRESEEAGTRMREGAKFHTTEKTIGNSCADVATLQGDAAAAKDPAVADRYTKLAAERRADAMQSITSRVRHSLDRHPTVTADASGMIVTRPSLAASADPEAHRTDLSETKTLAESLRCYDADAATKLVAEVDTWAAEWDAAVSAEEACRASPKCMADRLVAPLCEAIGDKRDALADIVRERQNPAGVINLTTLHDDGENVQDANQRIAELRKQYLALAKRPFNQASCPKTSP
jgi:hypothetical protein